jgi:WD40 repeat protein/DNA-binding SARP family transcriptional activator
MNEILRLSLLGAPQLLLGDRSLIGSATYKKAQALLFYLAVTAHTGVAPHRRDVLATLLWSELGEAQAKQNLRNVLPDLRRLVGDHVRIERQTIAFDRTHPYWLDVEVLRHSLEPTPASVDLAVRQAAVDLYQDEFLQGFHVHDAPLFEAWVVEQREQIHTLVVKALTALVGEHAQNNDPSAALAANRRLLRLEPWSEPVHRQQMLLLAQIGDRAAALAQYETCHRVLANEFGIEPMPETTALYEQIRAGEWGRQGDKETGKLGDQRSTEKVVSAQSAVSSPKISEQSQVEPTSAGHLPPESSLLAQVVGHNLPLRTKLFGRQAELANLHQWVVAEGCRLVGIFGIGGQGKTALTATFVRGLADTPPLHHPAFGGETAAATAQAPVGQTGFTHILWQSLLNAPPLADVLQEWIYLLSDQTVTSLPASLDQQIKQLLDYLRRQRCLLILDNLESILHSDERSGYYRPGYEGYGQILQQLAEREHHSCLLVTSRERPPELIHLEEETPAVRSLSLTGLPAEAGRQLLQGRGLMATQAGLGTLVEHYSGNPLALKLAAETVQEIFDGNIAAFLQTETLVFDDIRHVLDQQFARLTSLEHELLLWLAILREPVSFSALRDLLAQPPAVRSVLEAVRSLQRRSLLEKFDEGFGLQNVVLEYATDRLIEDFGFWILGFGSTNEQALIHNHQSSIINRHALILAQVKEYVRASQTRLLLQPVVDRLVNRLGSRGAEQQLQRLLVQLRTAPPGPGYAAANLLHLLLHLGVDLRGADFSHLYLRQAYLRGVSLPETNFTESQIIDSVFTEPFGLVYTAVFSPDGRYVAAGTSEGAIYLWRTTAPTGHPQLAHVIQAHQQAVKQLSFAQWTTAAGERHLVLASASDDKCVGVWTLTDQGVMHRLAQLAHAEQGALIAVGLPPDGQCVTSVDIDGSVSVWDVGEHQDPQLVRHFVSAFTRFRLVGFSGDGQTVAVGHRDGAVRLWQVATGEASLRLASNTGLIFALALRRDGQMLVTGGREGHLCLWRLPTGELHQEIATKAGGIHVLAFSPDGKFLVSGHEDLAVRLWTFDAQGRLYLHHTLLGHTQTIWSVAFGPSPAAQPAPRPETPKVDYHHATRQLLVTGSSDQTVRVWDVETGQPLYMLRGQPRVLAAHTLGRLPPTQPARHASEPGWLLAAAGYDQLIHLWQGAGSQTDGTHQVLRGARGPLYAVAISPNGRNVAGGGYDRTVYLWDRASGQLRQTYHGHTNRVYTLVFHPDGQLLASGSGDGTVRLWALPVGEWSSRRGAEGVLSAQPVAVLQADLDVVHDLTFSPDGRLLARGGSDRLLRLWDMTQPHYPELIEARRRVQDESEEDIFAVAFSPDGSKVACSGNHLIQLVDLSDGAAPLRLRQHTNWIFSVAFSPDGTTLASGSADCTICLWDVSTSLNTSVASGTLRAVSRGHSETIYKVAFTPDGTAVVSSSFDGTIKFWDSHTGDYINTLHVEGPYAGMNITNITGVTTAQKVALKALGAVEA